MLSDVTRMMHDKGQARRLQNGYRRTHRTLAAAWSMGSLRQALATRFVRNTMGQWCAADLEARRIRALRAQRQDDLVVEAEDQLPHSFLQYKVIEAVDSYSASVCGAERH